MKSKKSKSNTLKKGTVLLLCLLINLLSFSQGIYPRKVVIEGDTVVAISPEQLTVVNVLILDLAECKELFDIEKEENLRKTQLINSQSESMSIKDKEKKNLEEQNTILSDQNKALEKSLKRQKLKTKGTAILSAIIASGLTYLILK